MARIINTSELLETSSLDHNAKEFLRVSKQLRLDAVSGKLYWRYPKRGRNMLKPAGGITDSRGYIRITLDEGDRKYAHHIVWLLTNKKWPTPGLDIDHINDKSNKEANLRELTRSQNSIRRKDKMAGIRRVPSGRYSVKIGTKYVGTYDTLEEAVAIRKLEVEKWLA